MTPEFRLCGYVDTLAVDNVDKVVHNPKTEDFFCGKQQMSDKNTFSKI